MSPARRLPIFPLPLVLLPGATQPLHIFEPRYRRLLADCLEASREFGIICRTPEVAEREIPPGTAGCVAFIDVSQAIPDGRSNIVVTGTARFTLDHFVETPAPYHVADVTYFNDDTEDQAALQPQADALRELFVRVGRSARAIQDDTTPLPEITTDPAMVAFSIAQFIDLDLAEKQALLASRSPGDRLRRLDAALAAVVESIEQRARIHVRARTNGHGVSR